MSFVRGLGLSFVIAAVVALVSANAALAATNVTGLTFDVCGKWVAKLHDFGKFKIRDYNDLVAEGFPTDFPDGWKPRLTLQFLPDGLLAITFQYPDLQGVTISRGGFATYIQKGKAVSISLESSSEAAFAAAFGDLSQLHLFSARELLSIFDSVQLGKTKLKAKVKKGQLQFKYKSSVIYNIDTGDGIEIGFKGKFKARMRSGDCEER